ncbi:MAG: hypothetical protein HFH88_17810, partial [Lachnospiraceae bacterium]|nr:hypothetical protein [Lachnospiraceae bacterium]
MRKKVFPLILSVVFLLSACGSPEKEDNPVDLKEVFGCDFSQVKDAFQWPMEEAGKQELSIDSQPEKLYGYSIELNDVTFLGEEASSVYMQFLGETEEEAGLTLIYAQYSEEQQLDQVREQMTDIWGEPRQQMYCSWPGCVYWLDKWAIGVRYNTPSSFLQEESEEKIMWGSEEDVAYALKDCENPEGVYESWSLYSRIYAQSMTNDWEQVKKEPLVTGVMFKDAGPLEYKDKNVVILDGFNL